MKTIRSRNLCQVLLLTLLLSATDQVAYSTTIVWTNTLGGNWSVAANWDPNQVPGPADTANITNPGTYAVALDVNASVSSLSIGGANSGVQTLRGSSFTLAANAIVNGGGVLGLSNSSFSGELTIANGGLFNDSVETINAQVTVQSGAEFLANANTTLGGNANSSNEWLWVQSGGVMDSASGAPITLYVQMTNAGTLNFTNYGINSMYNPGNSVNYDGGFVNQAGGIMNLIGTAAISGSGGFDSVLNQGTINVTNGTSRINVDTMINQGTVAILPGTGILTIGNFNGPGTLTGTYNAAAGTIIKFVSNNNPGTSAGAGLTLSGSGQYQFTGGLLTLPTNVIPGLALDGGTLSLGAAFQGGAITNLTLTSTILTNTLPITGTLAMTNGTLSTTNTLSNGALLSLYATALYGSIFITNNGLLQTSGGALLDAQVTVENGGELLANGSTTLGGNVGSSNYWLWVQSGGLFDAATVAPITVYARMTNAGTVNFTNVGINSMYNPGNSPNYDGGLANQAGGIINLIGTAAISGSGGFDFVLNQGKINVTNGNSSINVDNFTNFAILNAGLWTLQLQDTHLNLQPGGLLEMAIGGPTSSGKFNITGNASLTGALVVSLANGYIPAAGSSFAALSYGSFSGGFTSFNLASLADAVWRPAYSSTALTLMIQPFIALLPSGTNVVASLNGTPGHQAVELSDTNLNVPLANWTPLSTNTFDVTTYLGITNNVDLNKPRQFFIFQLK